MSIGLNANNDGSGSVQIGGSDAINISTSLNVGIGTTTPYTSGGSKGVEIASSIQSGLILNNTAASGHRYITFSNSDGGFGNYDITDSVFVNTYAPGASGYQIFNTNGVERMRINSSGNVLVTNAAGLGYGTGSGGTVTQTTNKSTTVTLNKPTGQITMSNAALGAGAVAQFNFSNSLLAATDILVVNVNLSGVGIAGNYSIRPCMSAGLAQITVKNESGGSLSEAIILNFVIIKGVTS